MDPRVEKILKDERTRRAARAVGRGLWRRFVAWWEDREFRRAERRARRDCERAVEKWRRSGD